MIQLCRAEDGQVFQVNASLRDIERIGSLELFVFQEAGVEQDAVLAYLSDGRRLTNGNLRELAGSKDQTIFVFNKHYLDYDIVDVLRDLRVEPALQPPIEESIAATPPFRASELAASYLRTAHLHHEHITHVRHALHYQHEAIRIAASSLELNVLAIVDAFDAIAAGSRRELDKQALLLAGLEADLNLVVKVNIHIDFMSQTVRRAIEAGDKPRTLGDYVSRAKMMQVADNCARTHEELKARFQQVQEAVERLSGGTDAVRASVSDVPLIDDADGCVRRAQGLVDRITDGAAALEGPNVDSDAIVQDMRQLDTALRREVQLMADTKNAFTSQCVTALRQISVLNNDIVQIPPQLTNLQTSFRNKNSFSHIQRLHNMLYAYGATVIEVVRRKEFSRFFYQRAQSILEVMAKLSASERKRRQVYRSEVHGQLPFETRGMDDPVPTIDFSPSGSTDVSYSLERGDVESASFVSHPGELEEFANNNSSEGLAAVHDCRGALEKLVARWTIWNRVLSASRLSLSKRRSIEADEHLRAAREANARQEALFQEERHTLNSEIHKLKTTLSEANSDMSSEKTRADELERELQRVRAQLEGETAARHSLEEKNAELSTNIESQPAQTNLAQARSEFEDVKALESRHADKVACLLEDQANHLRILEEARARGDDLEVQIRAARSESDDVHQALREARVEKDRLLRAQASEHDRIIHGDRAVLERQFHELQLVQEASERQIKDLHTEIEVSNSDAVGLREELQRIERELRDARHVERLLRDDLRTGRASQSAFEQRLEDSGRLVAQILDVAISFRNSHVKALNSAQAAASHPNSKQPANINASLADSVAFSSGMRHSIIGQLEEPSPIDPADPAAALECLRAFDHDLFLEAVAKTGSVIRKWQKQCKEYRERAKGKISFRNFAKGDLALFLPTRNSVSKPWAAFNVSFPHYFLQATGHLAEQLKSREWIVARITSITERVVDQKDPTSNPYGLGDGVKYYMLEVEDWTQPSNNSKRRLSSRKMPSDKEPVTHKELTPDSSSPALPPGPPEAEVEGSFKVTHPPNSHLFPVRTRSNSSPTVRPSSLSRLLAQAAPDVAPETSPSSPDQPPSPTLPPPPAPIPSSPSLHIGSIPHHPSIPSPLRPGSRASRISSASRLSVSRIPALATPGTSSASKAAPTIALSEQPLIATPPSDVNTFGASVTPSPEGSISDGMETHVIVPHTSDLPSGTALW
ncbi:hypothetical protein BD779DRAFT_1526741 [Infundibulicybe gibba]|nr:hypothetical protein BD779DRAFT_1526741 [Infundibulicybe gibba]